MAQLVKPTSNLFTLNQDVQLNSHKIGLFAATPIVQPTADTLNAATNVYSTTFFADDTYNNNEKNMINNIWNALIGLGIIREI